MVMSQNATLSQELDVLRESLTRLQTSANQTLADLSEKEAELRIQKRERFECESKLYSAAAEHDRMKSDAQASAARMLQVKLLSSSSTITTTTTTTTATTIHHHRHRSTCCAAGRRSHFNERSSSRQRRSQQVPAASRRTVIASGLVTRSAVR